MKKIIARVKNTHSILILVQKNKNIFESIIGASMKTSNTLEKGLIIQSKMLVMPICVHEFDFLCDIIGTEPFKGM
jgi:hypothetical protein